MDTKMLEHIGLTKNESLVYLTLLQIGTSRTGEILKNSKLNSGKIYEILESLKLKGLVSESIIDNIKHFTAAPPAQLLEYIERKKQSITEDEEKVRSLLPQLEILRTTTLKQEVKAVTYTGLRGIKTAVEEATEQLKKGDQLLGMGITGSKPEKFNAFWKQWTRKNLAEKFTIKYIFFDRTEYAKELKNSAGKKTKIRFLEGITPAPIDIFGEEYVLIFNYQEPVSCISIHGKNIAASFKQFFEQLWKIAKE